MGRAMQSIAIALFGALGLIGFIVAMFVIISTNGGF
jgi:hypothetical protein